MKIPALVVALILVSVLPAAAETRPLETGGFAFDLEVQVPVAPERAFDAFTLETLEWWDHHFSEQPKSLRFDPRPGGGFTEVFDDAGNGARHATVIYAARPKKLRFEGPLGLSGSAVQMVHTLEFEPVEGGTRVKLAVHAAGEYDKGWPAIVETVWKHFLAERFVPYVKAHPSAPAAAAKGAKREPKSAGRDASKP